MTENKKKTFSQNESNLLAKDEIKQMVENKRQQALRLRKQKLEEKKTNKYFLHSLFNFFYTFAFKNLQ